MNGVSPAASEYRERIQQRRQSVSRYTHRLRRRAKIHWGCIFGLIGMVVFDPTIKIVLVPAAILLVPVIVFQLILSRRLAREWRAARHFERALLRIEGEWIGDGDAGQRYLQENELFADDLDLFGQGSLFQFLCTARTSSGKDTLARWLRNPAAPEEIRERQDAIRELCADVDFREHLAVVELDENKFKPESLSRWAEAPLLFANRPVRLVGLVLVYALITSFVIWMVTGKAIWLLLGILVFELLFYASIRHRLGVTSLNAYYATRTMLSLSTVGTQLQNKTFRSNRLKNISSSFSKTGWVFSRAIPFAYGVVGAIPLLHCLVCQALPQCEHWRQRTGKRALNQLKNMGELQALASLSQYAYEQTDTVFPEIVGAEACFAAKGLGHPLISSDDRVTNDIQLGENRRLLLVSGSNMSGKSTMLRTVGINAVLAHTGAPVCASELRTSSLAIGTAMRFHDSLENRTSHFFAVIRRIRSVMELLESTDRPVLFLIDEILQGTNSHDRLIGAEAIVRKLVDGDAIGLVTTHDLELARIVDGLGERASNVHFVDEVIAGEIRFNYKMQPGIVKTSNALLLMRKMGLDV